MTRRLGALLPLLLLSGCSHWPQRVHEPVVHNPYPQLMRVAVAPFFNLSSEPSVDGRQFALAYFNELQLVQGFEVVPVGVVEKALESYRLSLGHPADVRRLAQLLEVDAVVVGAITDFSPYYPPRCGLRVEWYAANPGFHPIPPGYGLPWGTPDEGTIPPELVLETEMALARAQLETQTPLYEPEIAAPRPLELETPPLPEPDIRDIAHDEPAGSEPAASEPEELPAPLAPMTESEAGADAEGMPLVLGAGLPPDWPDPAGLLPGPPAPQRPVGQPTDEPVLRHTRVYNGHDAEFKQALSDYVFIRDDDRSGGVAAYLQRSDDFIRFCCHEHITEMLAARGGAGKTRVVWRWPDRR